MDQYGENINLGNLEVKVKTPDTTIHGVPAKDVQLKVEGSTVSFADSTDADLAKEGTLHLVLEYTVGTGDDKVTKQLVKDIEIQAGDDVKKPVATEITKLNAETVVADGEKPKEIKDFVDAEAEVKVTPEVIDQYGNAITAEAQNLRWAITKGADLIKVTAPENSGKVFNAKEIKYKALAPGEVVIDVFLPNGDKQTHKVTIGEVAINELTFEVKADLDKADLVNHKEIDLGTLSANKGAELKAEDIKFDVTKKVDGKDVKVELPSKEIEVTAVANEVEDGEDATYTIKATTKAAGEYTVTPYVDGDKDKIKSKESATFTTKVESTVKEATIADFNTEANTLKVKKQGNELVEVKKEIVFKNQYGEVVEPEEDKEGNITTNVTINSSNPNILEVGDITVEDVKEGGKVVGKKYFVTVTPKTEGKAVLTLQGTGKPVVYPFDIEDAVLDKVKVGKPSIGEMIAGDKVGEELVAEYNKVELLDQDGDNMPVEDLEFEVTNAKGEKVTEGKVEVTLVKAYYDEKEEKFVELEDGATNEKAEDMLKVTVDKSVNAGKHTIKVIAQKENKAEELKEVATTFTVDVKEARKAKELKVDPTSTNIALDGQAKVLVTLTDQYGDPFALKDGEDIKVTVKDLAEDATSPFSEDSLEAIPVKDEVGQYEFTVKPVVDSGQYTLLVSYTVEEGDKPVVIEEEVTVTVGVGAELVKSLEIENEKNEIVDGKATYFYKAGVAGQPKDEDASNEKPFSLVAKDENGEIVNIDTAGEGITWHSSNPDVATVDKDGKVTTKELPENTEETVEVWADYYGAVTTEKVTIVVSNKEEKIQPNTLQATVPVEVDGEDKDQIVTEVVIDENATDGTITLTYTGTDQYGDSKDAIDFSTLQIPNKTVAIAEQLEENDEKTNKVKITAVKEGEANIRTVIDGAELNLPIIVKKEAVANAEKAAEELAAAKEAYNNAVAAAEEAEVDIAEHKVENVETATTKELNDAAKKINDAVKAAKDLEAAKDAYTKAVAAAEEADVDITDYEVEDVETATAEKLNEATEAINDAVKAAEDLAEAKDAYNKAVAAAEEADVDITSYEVEDVEAATTEELNNATKAINDAVKAAKELEAAKELIDQQQVEVEAGKANDKAAVLAAIKALDTEETKNTVLEALEEKDLTITDGTVTVTLADGVTVTVTVKEKVAG